MERGRQKIAIIGASGKLGRELINVAISKNYEIVAVCREKSVKKLHKYRDKITLSPGYTNDRYLISRALKNCDGVMCILVPWGLNKYSTGTAQAVLDFSEKNDRLIFSCGWHITMDERDQYSKFFLYSVKVMTWIFRALRIADVDDQVEACNRVFKSKTKWTIVRGSDLEDGESQGLPAWSDYVGDAILTRNKTRRVDYASFMMHAMENEKFIHRCPAISAAMEV